MSFDNIFSKIIDLEAGFQNNPNDRGNWTGGAINVGILKGTKYGISAASYPEEDIENMTIPIAKELYMRDFWIPLRLFDIISESVQHELLDTAINMGIRTSIRIAQRAINFLEIGKPLIEDGLMGPLTSKKIQEWIIRDEDALLKALDGFQFMRYVEITENNPTQERFARGWMKRIAQWRNKRV